MPEKVLIVTDGASESVEQIVVDGRLISSPTWESHPAFYRDIFTHLAKS